MRFWHDSPSFEDRRELKLLEYLDIAYLSLLPPLLPILKFPMLLFLAWVALLAVLKKGRSDTARYTLTTAGLAAIVFSLYGDLNVVGLSRLRVFVELLLYLLLLAISLQRLTRIPNRYLVVSPALILALLLFFYDNLWMLAYVIVEIFLLLWVILSWQMREPLSKSLKTAAFFYVLALPMVVLLFILFPRISFGHAAYGFRDISRLHLFWANLRLDRTPIERLSNRIVMEVAFAKNGIPPASKLYFRGSVLYIDKLNHWEPLPPSIKRRYAPTRYAQSRLERSGEVTIYRVTLYPTGSKWLYMLDLPVEAAEGAAIDADFQTTLNTPITEVQIYDAASALDYRYGRKTEKGVLRYALQVDASANPRTAEAAKAIKARYPDESRRFEALWRFFQKRGLTYTLTPPPLDTNHTADSFLFDVKKGYCVHFAAAFTVAARLAGLPARIVTGFKADPENSVRNYLIVRERDAHAWVEVYLNRSWRRVETTAAAVTVEKSAQNIQNVSQKGNSTDSSRLLDLYLLYAKYRLEKWILHYTRFRQMQLLELMKKNRNFAVAFIGIFLFFVLAVYLAVRILRRPSCPDRTLCILRPLLRRLEKAGLTPAPDETLHAFFERVAASTENRDILKVDELYHQVRYGHEKNLEKALKHAVKKMLQNLRNKSQT